MRHKAQPSFAGLADFPELNEEEKKGLAIAAYICRMYGEGERWAEVIESHGEQMRARFWMKKESE